MDKKYIFLTLCFFLCACEDQAPSGRCIDLPEVSKDSLAFNAFGGADSVSINRSSWGFVSYHLWENGCEQYRGSITNFCSGDSCFGETVRVECPWFELQKIDAYTISVSVYPNETQTQRSFQVYIETGNCGVNFAITQSAE